MIAGLLLVAGVTMRWLVQRQREALRQRFSETLSEERERSGDARVGTRVDGLVLTRKLGDGASSSVYQALPVGSLSLRHACAVKVLHSFHNAVEQGRLEREVSALRSLRHPNVVRFHRFIDQPDLKALVFDYLPGDTLRVRSASAGWNEKLMWIEELLQAVRSCHQQRVVHRDIKPDNVMIDDRGSAILVDFGLCKGAESEQLTGLHEALGTPSYMAPEQLQGEPGEAADQWALGVVIYELLSGRLPFGGKELFEVVTAICTQPAPALPPDVPPALRAVVERMLQKEPSERFSSVREALLAWQAATRRGAAA